MSEVVETVTVTIDGFEISVPKGTLIIRAAEELGIEIPRFCDHPALEPVAACRACLVEIEGQPKPQPSCAIPVADGMKVRTGHTSEMADIAQKGVMEFILSNHPLDCPVCDKGGECPLQNQAMSVGRAESRFDIDKGTFEKPINLSTQILLDRERCVNCARCTRFADQVAGDPLITLQQRGSKQQVGISDDQPFDSYFSGNTVQICPVGALTSAGYRFRARPFDLVSVPTVCEHCSAGCALRSDVRRGMVQRRLAWEDHEVNEDWNCDKGRYAFKYTTESRLKLPLVRGADGALHQASWPEAVNAAAAGLAKALGGRTAVLAGGRHTLEDAFAISKFARGVLGTDDVDFRARPHSAEEAAFLAAAVAGTGVGVSFADLERASHVVLVAFDPEDENPIVLLRLRKSARRGRTKVTAIASHMNLGLEKLRAQLIPTKAGDEVAALANAGVTSDSIILVGERAASVPGLLSAVIATANSTGAKFAWIPRRAGERAAIDAGLLPGLLPGGRQLVDEAARNEVASAWGVDAAVIPTIPGRDFAGIIAAANSDAYEALLVTGIDADDTVNPDATLAALQAAPFVVALELAPTAITALADVVFPVASVNEKAGSFVNWEGRNRAFGPAVNNNRLTDARVLAMIADAMDVLIGRQEVPQLRAEIAQLANHSGFRAAAPSESAVPAEGITLSTWAQLLDAGVLQTGEPFLAGTARDAAACISANTARDLGIADGDSLTVSSAKGSITVPARIVEAADGSVWLPTNSIGSHVRTSLGAVHGSVVALAKGGAA